MFESIFCQVTECDPDVLEYLIGLEVEMLARAEREGVLARYSHSGMRKAVLAKSRTLILDPLLGHPESCAPPHQSQSRRSHQGIGAAGRWVCSESRWNCPFGVPLSRCRGRTGGCAVGSWQPSHCCCQHERGYQSRWNWSSLRVRWYGSSVMDNWSAKSFPSFG